MRRSIWIGCLIFVAIGLHLFVFPEWATSRYIINLAVLLVIIVTLRRGLVAGVIMGICVGLIETGFSAIPGPTHVVTQISVALITWFVSTKLFTTRSSASLVFTTSIATIFYGLLFIVLEACLTAFNHQRITMPWLVMLLVSGCTMILHPVFISLLWRWNKWNRYSEVTARTHA